MDAGQIGELRRWGRRLAEDESHPELQPAGRAILLLIDEIERLRSSAPPSGRPPGETEDDAPAGKDAENPAPRRRRGLFRLAIALGAVGALLFATLALGARISAPSLDAEGPSQGAGIGPALLPSLAFSVGGAQSTLDHVHWKLDGVDVTSRAYASKGRLVFDGRALGDGPHRLRATAAGGFPGSRTTRSWRFTRSEERRVGKECRL